ncbi:MAG: cytochrome [Mycobacterium sp.]|nr:cytochrome [Mycobacterium sp.]
MSTEINDTAATVTPPQKFTALSRMFHWLTAILIFAALLIGFTMVNWLAGYATLRVVHMSIGILVLIVVVLRIVNRLRHHPPAWPPTVGRREGKAVIWLERALYALILAQPLVGWAMVSATGKPVRVFGVLPLPRIAPFNIDVYSVLRETHSILAYLLVVVIAAHVSLVLAHTTVLRDGMLRRMTFQLRPARK